jgi:phage terminase small subunit
LGAFIFLLKEVETLSLTTKQELFIQGLIKGYSQRESYKMAYEADNMKNESIDVKASNLFKQDKIRLRYEELKNELKEKAFYTVEKANDDLNWIKLKAKEDIEAKGIKQANANTYLGAVKQQIELNGITIKEAKADIDNIIKFEIVGAKNE